MKKIKLRKFNINKLSVDTWINIFSYLKIKSIISCRLSCKSLSYVSYSSVLWTVIIKRFGSNCIEKDLYTLEDNTELSFLEKYKNTSYQLRLKHLSDSGVLKDIDKFLLSSIKQGFKGFHFEGNIRSNGDLYALTLMSSDLYNIKIYDHVSDNINLKDFYNNLIKLRHLSDIMKNLFNERGYELYLEIKTRGYGKKKYDNVCLKVYCNKLS